MLNVFLTLAIAITLTEAKDRRLRTMESGVRKVEKLDFGVSQQVQQSVNVQFNNDVKYGARIVVSALSSGIYWRDQLSTYVASNGGFTQGMLTGSTDVIGTNFTITYDVEDQFRITVRFGAGVVPICRSDKIANGSGRMVVDAYGQVAGGAYTCSLVGYDPIKLPETETDQQSHPSVDVRFKNDVKYDARIVLSALGSGIYWGDQLSTYVASNGGFTQGMLIGSANDDVIGINFTITYNTNDQFQITLLFGAGVVPICRSETIASVTGETMVDADGLVAGRRYTCSLIGYDPNEAAVDFNVNQQVQQSINVQFNNDVMYDARIVLSALGSGIYWGDEISIYVASNGSFTQGMLTGSAEVIGTNFTIQYSTGDNFHITLRFGAGVVPICRSDKIANSSGRMVVDAYGQVYGGAYTCSLVGYDP